jgi:hypothetical protein
LKNESKYIKILRDNESSENFLIGDKERKVLLQKELRGIDAAFLSLEEITEKLLDFDFEIGVAFKTITAPMEILINVDGETFNCEKTEKINFILRILDATLGVGNENELQFFSMNAEMLNFKIPIGKNEKISILIDLIGKIIDLHNIVMPRSRLETLDLLTRNDNNWKFFMPINAKLTSFLAIRNLPNLITYFKHVEWIVGNLDIPKMRATGYLFIIRNSVVHAVCLDDYDLIYLKEKCSNLTETSLKFLSPQNLKYSLHRERAQYSEKIIRTIDRHNETLAINEFGLKSFEEENNEKLMNALELACILQSRINIETNFIAAIAKFALKENEALSGILSSAGFSINDLEFTDQVLSDGKREAIKDSINKLLKKIDPLFTKINIAIQVLNDAINYDDIEVETCNKNVKHIIDDILNDQSINDEIKKNIVIYNDKDLNEKCARIKSELEKFLTKETLNEAYFHTRMLHSVLINNDIIYYWDIIENYIKKIELNESIFKSVKRKLLKELKEKHYNQLVATLFECSLGVKYYILHQGIVLNISIIFKILNTKDGYFH